MLTNKKPCAIIGAGRIGRFYGEVLRNSAHFQLIGHCDPRPEARAEPMVEGCPVYSDLDALLEHEQITAAVICAPPDSHLELVMRCIERGVHVLCEKPLALNSAGCAAIEQALLGSSARLALSSKFRYVPAIAQARRLLMGGALGRLQRLVIDFSATLDVHGDWRADAARGGGVLADNGAHAADLGQFLLGELGAIEGCRLTRATAAAVEHAAYLSLRYGNGARGEVRLSWRDDPAPLYLTIEGSAASIEIGWRESRVRRGTMVSPIENGSYNKYEAFNRMLDDFAACVDGRLCTLSDLPSARRYVAWVESAYQAAQIDSDEGGDFVELSPEKAPAPRF